MSEVVKLDIYRVLSASEDNPHRYFIPSKCGKRVWHGVGLDLKTRHQFHELNTRERESFGRDSNFEHVVTLDVVMPSPKQLDEIMSREG